MSLLLSNESESRGRLTGPQDCLLGLPFLCRLAVLAVADPLRETYPEDKSERKGHRATFHDEPRHAVFTALGDSKKELDTPPFLSGDDSDEPVNHVCDLVGRRLARGASESRSGSATVEREARARLRRGMCEPRER